MPALATVPPKTLKRIMELAGYELAADNLYTWVLICNRHPIVIPKLGPLVSLEIMENVLGSAQIDHQRFFELKSVAEAEERARAAGAVAN